MCSAQIARLAAERMNANGAGATLGYDRFVTLTHTEGCGFGGESMYQLLQRTYRGYVTHPNVTAALLLEHGCEKIPNDAMRRQFETAGLPLERFGWASVQLDGGIQKSLDKVEAWFARAAESTVPVARTATDMGALAVGLLSATRSGQEAAVALARVAGEILAAGGTVLVPEGDALLADAEFRRQLLGNATPRATLAYGQPFTRSGLHIVATESDHWVENITGLGGCGAHMILGLVGDTAQQGHPMLPVLQAALPGALSNSAAKDVDLVLSKDAEGDAGVLLKMLQDVAAGELVPAASAGGFVDFQLSRGLLGVST